jgi:hypothetical protein
MSINSIVKELKESGSIVTLLDRLGYQPVPKKGRETMYLSMLRDNDKSPSMSVNDQLGVWFDHGAGKGGNIIDFGIAYWKGLNFVEVVQKIQETLSSGAVAAPKIVRPQGASKKPNYIVYQTKPLGTHPAITEYLQSRGVFQVAKPHLREVYYYVEDEKGDRKNYFSAGWQNEHMAWEVRNRLFKGCMGPKAISFLPDNPKKVAAFEGFLDFLSWKTEHPADDRSIIVLNAVTMLNQGIIKAKAFPDIDIYFDRDKAGIMATRDMLKALPYATDKSKAYEGFNDYNDKIQGIYEAVETSRATPHFLPELKVPFRR